MAAWFGRYGDEKTEEQMAKHSKNALLGVPCGSGWTLLYFFVSAYRYITITNLSIIAVFVEYLRQFSIDLNQIYRHSSVPQNTSP